MNFNPQHDKHIFESGFAGASQSFFAAYIGPSMNPTLCEPEMIEVMPYDNRPLRVGDVAFYQTPDVALPVVHRIIRVTPEGIATLGDNNTQQDAYLLSPQNIKGRVVAAWRGQRRRKIYGGLHGRLTSRWFRWRRAIDRGVSPLLHPIYNVMSQWRLLAWILPASLRPRVVTFHSECQDQFHLMLGKRMIGKYDKIRQQWQIQRPFHLFVDGRALPRRQDRERLNRKALIERRRTMMTHGPRYNLVFADGSHWEIAAGDAESVGIVSQLGSAMRLRVSAGYPSADVRRLIVQTDEKTSVADCHVPLSQENDGIVVCILNPSGDGGSFANLQRLSLILAREAQVRGGVLIHGALAERDGAGVIMTAPGGTGKTTASNRIQGSWNSLCDDTTLIVKDSLGEYWAHPWPTWSRYMDGGPGGSWDVQRAVRLKGIFILNQAVEDMAEPVGNGQAVSLLVECVRQAAMLMPLGMFKAEVHALNLERFHNLCAMVKVIPAHTLHISLTGAFWLEIDKALADRSCNAMDEKVSKKSSILQNA